MRKTNAQLMKEAETNISLAKNIRYLKPLCTVLNTEQMLRDLDEMTESCDEVAYAINTNSDELLGAMLGADEDEAWGFRMAFSDLSAECQQMYNELMDEPVLDNFDLFMSGVHGDRYGGMMGYDAYEGDYFGLSSYEIELAVERSQEQLQRLTKDQMVETAVRCFAVAINYMGLRDRWAHLHNAIDVIKGGNKSLIKAVKRLEELYEIMQSSEYEWKIDVHIRNEWNNMLDLLPPEAWIA